MKLGIYFCTLTMSLSKKRNIFQLIYIPISVSPRDGEQRDSHGELDNGSNSPPMGK